jgi:hypothetical protein
LRRRRRRRLGDPLHDRTLRHPPCAERDRVAERDDHRADATAPDHLGQADLDPNPDHGRASDLAHDHARDLG